MTQYYCYALTRTSVAFRPILENLDDSSTFQELVSTKDLQNYSAMLQILPVLKIF